MNDTSSSKWFIEKFSNEGTCFGLEITAKLHEEQSRYQHIQIYETKTFGKLMVLDGCVMLTERDNFLYHEMITHPALFCHAHPQRVVIIGGGDCGTLQQVLRHPNITQAWQIEIDERVTKLSETYFPSLCEDNNDSRAQFHFGDGIAWIQSCATESLDIIIIDSTDPVGPAAGLFSADFYQECFRCLREGGIIVQQSESPLLHASTIIKNIHQNLKLSGFSSSLTLPFPQPVYPSGWWSVTLGGKNIDTTSYRKIDVDNKPFTTDYYNANTHAAALAQPEFLKRALENND